MTTYRCNVCKRYINGDWKSHIREKHGGLGILVANQSVQRNPPPPQRNVFYGQYPELAQPAQVQIQPHTQVQSQLAAPNQPLSSVMQQNQSLDWATIPPTHPDPTVHPYQTPSSPFAVPGHRLMYHPVIMQRQKKIEEMEKAIENGRRALAVKQVQVEEERKQVQEANQVLVDHGGMVEPVEDGIEYWWVKISRFFGINIPLRSLLGWLWVIFLILNITPLGTWLAKLSTPLISYEGRLLLEKRGQSVEDADQYILHAQAEWLNLHRAFEAARQKGTDAIGIVEFRIKTTLMTIIAEGTIDQLYLSIHHAVMHVEQCSARAQLSSRGNKNDFSNQFGTCLDKLDFNN